MSKPSLAIAYSMKKKAKGGKVLPKQAYNPERRAEEGVQKAYLEMDEPGYSGAHHQIDMGRKELAKEDHKKALEQLKKMPTPDLKKDGGEVKGVHVSEFPGGHYPKGESEAGHNAKMAHKTGNREEMFRSKELHKANLEELKSMPNPDLKAEGGEVFPALKGEEGQIKNGYQSPCCGSCGQPMPVDMKKEFAPGADIVSKVLGSRFSEGGEVANEDFPIADEMPAEFDDLVKEDSLEFDATSANEGDEEDEDVIKRVLAKRKK